MGSQLLCMIVVFLASGAQGTEYCDVATAFEAYDLTPDVIHTAPEILLNVTYPSAEVCLGDEISPTQILLPPKISFHFKPDVNYTVIMIDPDVSSAQAPTLRSYLNWLKVNLCGDNTGLEVGLTIADYIPLIAYPGSGYHRGIVLMYEQTKPLDLEAMACSRMAIKRYRFNVVAFAKTYGLTLVAGNFFRVRVPAVYDEYYCQTSSDCQTIVYE